MASKKCLDASSLTPPKSIGLCTQINCQHTDNGDDYYDGENDDDDEDEDEDDDDDENEKIGKSKTTQQQPRTNDASSKRHLIQVSRLIDLTDKPIGMRREDISWATVKTNASNCICCCLPQSITLVTQENSYIFNHTGIENIVSAQASADLQYLAIANDRKLVIVDLVDQSYSMAEDYDDEEDDGKECTCCVRQQQQHSSDIGSDDLKNVKRTVSCSSSSASRSSVSATSSSSTSSSMNETRVVHLSGLNLTMADVVFWRWLDCSTLAILTCDALYTCSLNQQLIAHPAYTALAGRSKLLKLKREFDVHQHLSRLCQVTNIHCDPTATVFAISSLYSTGSLVNYQQTSSGAATSNMPTFNNQQSQLQANISNNPTGNATLRPSFGSMPSRLSQLASSLEGSLEGLKLEHINRKRSAHQMQAMSKGPSHKSYNNHAANSNNNQRSTETDEICGLVQIHCKQRRRSQLIQTQAVAFTSLEEYDSNNNNIKSTDRTMLVAANKINNQMRIHFVELSTGVESCSSGQNSAITTKFDHLANVDLPTFIVCTHVSTGEPTSRRLHVALIATKCGQIFVCSIKHNTVLFNTIITNDVISSAILERNTRGLMVVCRNGQVLLVQLNLSEILKLLEENKTLRHISSSYFAISQTTDAINKTSTGEFRSVIRQSKSSHQLSSSHDLNLELISTKL